MWLFGTLEVIDKHDKGVPRTISWKPAFSSSPESAVQTQLPVASPYNIEEAFSSLKQPDEKAYVTIGVDHPNYDTADYSEEIPPLDSPFRRIMKHWQRIFGVHYSLILVILAPWLALAIFVYTMQEDVCKILKGTNRECDEASLAQTTYEILHENADNMARPLVFWQDLWSGTSHVADTQDEISKMPYNTLLGTENNDLREQLKTLRDEISMNTTRHQDELARAATDHEDQLSRATTRYEAQITDLQRQVDTRLIELQSSQTAFASNLKDAQSEKTQVLEEEARRRSLLEKDNRGLRDKVEELGSQVERVGSLEMEVNGSKERIKRQTKMLKAQEKHDEEKKAFDHQRKAFEEEKKASSKQENDLQAADETIEQQRGEVAQQKREIAAQKGEIAQQKREIAQQKREISQQKVEMAQQKGEIVQQKEEIEQLKNDVEAQAEKLLREKQIAEELAQQLQSAGNTVQIQGEELERMQTKLVNIADKDDEDIGSTAPTTETAAGEGSQAAQANDAKTNQEHHAEEHHAEGHHADEQNQKPTAPARDVVVHEVYHAGQQENSLAPTANTLADHGYRGGEQDEMQAPTFDVVANNAYHPGQNLDSTPAPTTNVMANEGMQVLERSQSDEEWAAKMEAELFAEDDASGMEGVQDNHTDETMGEGSSAADDNNDAEGEDAMDEDPQQVDALTRLAVARGEQLPPDMDLQPDQGDLEGTVAQSSEVSSTLSAPEVAGSQGLQAVMDEARLNHAKQSQATAGRETSAPKIQSIFDHEPKPAKVLSFPSLSENTPQEIEDIDLELLGEKPLLGGSVPSSAGDFTLDVPAPPVSASTSPTENPSSSAQLFNTEGNLPTGPIPDRRILKPKAPSSKKRDGEAASASGSTSSATHGDFWAKYHALPDTLTPANSTKAPKSRKAPRAQIKPRPREQEKSEAIERHQDHPAPQHQQTNNEQTSIRANDGPQTPTTQSSRGTTQSQNQPALSQQSHIGPSTGQYVQGSANTSGTALLEVPDSVASLFARKLAGK